MNRFNFESYIESKFTDILETSNPDRVRVCCPFCSDDNSHLYVLVSEGLVYCQRCKYNPKSPIKFISDLDGVSVKSVLSYASDDYFAYSDTSSVGEIVDKMFAVESEKDFDYEPMVLGDEFVSLFEVTGIPSIDKLINDAKKYLYKRELSDSDIKKFDIRFCYSGKYSGRVIVPCLYKGDIVSFVGRDMFGVSDRKYLNPIGNKQSDFLFNFDSIGSDTVVLTEGVFDTIRIDSVWPTVASFGKSLSRRQIELLSSFRKVIFYWDRDAYPQAERYVDEIHAECVTVLQPDGNDAGSRRIEESMLMIKDAVHFSSAEYHIYRTVTPS